MSYTLESVMKQLGDEAQLTGGQIVVYRDGKHTEIGGVSLSTGVFSLTEAGKIMLGEDKPAKAAPAKGKKDAKPAEDSKDEELLDLNLE